MTLFSNYTLFHPKGIVAAAEMHILLVATLLMLVVVIPVIFMALYFSWRYRDRDKNTHYQPNWAHHTGIEIVCWTIPCIIIIILGWITWTSAHELDPYRRIDAPQPPLVIQVIAYEWKWLFIYPEQHIASVNFIQFPVNVPIEFLITAHGPMNSFQIPQLAGQIYAMAGMKTALHLLADTEGDYKGMSTNFSGDGFAGMTFTARVSSQKDFETWVKGIQNKEKPLTATRYDEFIAPSEHHPIQFFSKVDSKLFEHVLMVPMMPMSPNPIKM